jgi:hypothetical protein
MDPIAFVLTANGTTDKSVEIGKEYTFKLKGNFDGATVTMTTRSLVNNGEYDSVEGGAFTDEAEQLFLADCKEIRLTVTGAGGSTAIRASFVKRKYQSE